MDHHYLVDFLQENQQEIYTEWIKQDLIFSDDIMKKEIIDNAISFYHILIDRLQNNTDTVREDLQALAMGIASQRIASGVPLIEMLYNFSLIRAALINYISEHFIVSSNWKTTVDYFIHELQHHTILNFIEFQNNLKQPFSISDAHKDRLILLGQMTSSFVHEFRNPLTSIKGFVQLLKSEHPTLKYVDIILNELDQLNTRISQFLLLSRKEDSQSYPCVFSLNQLVEDIILFIYPSVVSSNVSISTNIETNITLFGHREEIRQVLLNIILNALEVLTFTDKPIITLSGFQSEESVKIIIANNGPEIKKEILSDIFKPFITTKQSGTGLGLFVCKEIIEKHKGRLTCTTSKDETCFTITLPVSNSNPSER